MNICKSLANYTVKKVKRYVELDSKKEAKVIYGLYCFFSNFIKIPLVFLLAYFIGLFKETAIFFCVFAGLRSFSFGMHAEKSWQCTISNFLVFNGGTILAVKIDIIPSILVCMSVFSFIVFILYAPADTRARPLKKPEKRRQFKINTIIVLILIIIVVMFIKNYDYKKIMIAATLVQAVNILPVTYYFFKKPYRNYLNYNE